MKLAKNITVLSLILVLLSSLTIAGFFANIELKEKRYGYVGGLSFLDCIIFLTAYLITIILIYLFYRFGMTKYNLFALPVSFLILPVLLYMLLSGARLFVKITSCPAGWEIWAVIAALFYALPFSAVTFIISLKLKK